MNQWLSAQNAAASTGYLDPPESIDLESDSEASTNDNEYDDYSDTRWTSDQMPSTSHQEGEDGASWREQVIALGVEEAKQLIKIFQAETSCILSDRLMAMSLRMT